VTLLYLFIAFQIFWFAFAGCISVYRKWVDGSLSTFNKAMFLFPLMLFTALDVAGNYTLFLVFGWPPKGCYTISSRMERYRYTELGFKRKFADRLCGLLSELDPTGAHC